MDAILQTIRQKLSRGENLSINDFNSLEQIHVNNVMTYSNGNNNDNNNDDDDNDDGSSNNVIEYLDRSLILHDDQQAAAAAAAVAVDGKDITTCTHLQPRLVRYVGMVQDMLDPEYYESSDKYGRSTHFVDHCDLLNNNNNNEDNDEDNENDNDNENHKCWAERIPLVVVPIPFASKWLMGSCSDNNKERLRTNINSKSVAVVVSPVSSSNNRAGDRKRGRDDNSNNDDQDSTMKEDNDDDTDKGKNTISSTTTDHHHQPSNNKRTMTSSTSEEKDNNINNLTTTTTDWWPAGTCGTSIDQCPVLAKICYDQLLSSLSSKQQQQQKQKQRPLKLNDVVSLVGVLSMNPWEADFSAQSCSTTRVADDGIGICGFEVDSHNEYYVPPPSRLPRLHVLSYKQFDLDDLAKQAIGVANKKKSRNSNNNNNNRMDGDDDEICTTNSSNNRNNDDDTIEQRSCSMEEEEEEEELEIIDGRGGGRGSIERTSSLLALDPLSSSLSSTALWTRALYLSLLSDAERQHPQNNPGGDDDVETLPATMVRVGPAERALGCVSLRLSTPDVTSSKALFRQLAEDILPEICPVVAVVDLTTTMMNNNDFSLFPRKDSQGRLKPCPLQLPKGSVVLIHYPLSTNKKNENNQDDAQRETILRDLVQHHRLPYQFEGGVVIPFEADYRIIVVTTQTQELPCTLSVLATTGIGMSSTSSATTTGTETIPSKPELREILMKGRLGNGSTGNDELKKFSSSFLQRAQKDFLERRQRFHQTSSSTLPGEDDFHRWLSLTRLHTKSRRSIDGLSPNGGEAMMVEEIEGPSLSSSSAPLPSEEYWEPTVEDWEAALQLDDAIRDMV